MKFRFAGVWPWRVFIIILVLCAIPTILLVSLSTTWKQISFDEHIFRNSSLHEQVSLKSEVKFEPQNVIMRRFPYPTDSACQNFSLSLFEDETFEITGLVSFPGSGNTWTRHLIQLATGVLTGSVYFDMELFSQGFLGEKEAWFSGRTIVQKFHEKYSKDMDIKKAIYLIREPFPAILSFANYLEGGHTGHAIRLPYHHKDWPSFLIQSTYNWLSLAKSWLESPVEVLVIHYEHLRLQPVENMERICMFLNHTCQYLGSPCFKRKLEGSFRRARTLPVHTHKDATRLARYPDDVRNVISRGVDHLNAILHRDGHEPLPLSLYQYYTPKHD